MLTVGGRTKTAAGLIRPNASTAREWLLSKSVALDKPVQFDKTLSPPIASSARFSSRQNGEALTDLPARGSVELPKNGDCAAEGGSSSNLIILIEASCLLQSDPARRLNRFGRRSNAQQLRKNCSGVYSSSVCLFPL
jgi:hypothetical protein